MGKESQMMNSTYRWIVVLIGIMIAMVAVVVGAKAQAYDGLLYGKVYTENGNSYTGIIRWGTEEALWTDLFNASKVTDQFKKMVPEKERDNSSWMDIDWNFGGIWEDKIIPHQFNCQFGNLRQIERLPANRARLTFKNGVEMEVSGEGYNDLGSRIYVADAELGTLGFDWENVDRVEFSVTPSRPEVTFGAPLYGTVEGLRREKFTGFIAWDNDERLAGDKLDGESDDGKVSIKFSDIVSIENARSGSKVVLKSGRELVLTGSNDVNDENRGVLVSTSDIGIVKVNWSAFHKIEFSTPPRNGIAYEHFGEPTLLSGTVSSLNGDDATGRIIYDIDEMLDFEIIEGMENDIEYHLPIRSIRSIAPRNYDYSTVELRSGRSLLLGGMQDVSAKNGGILVFTKEQKEPVYISWKKITEIRFN